VMPTVAFEEVHHKTPDCGKWLKDKNIKQLPINNTILQDASRIKGLLRIVDDKYHAKGVDENDILIIATARAHGGKLVSDEAKQIALPDILSKYKIPAVCNKMIKGVDCINFIEYIKHSKAVFR